MVFKCKFCGRDDFRSERGYNSHLLKSNRCSRSSTAEVSSQTIDQRVEVEAARLEQEAVLVERRIKSGQRVTRGSSRRIGLREALSKFEHDLDARDSTVCESTVQAGTEEDFEQEDEKSDQGSNENDVEGEKNDVESRQENDLSDDLSSGFGSTNSLFGEDEGEEDEETPANATLMEEWDDFTASQRFVAPLMHKEVAGIRLLETLRAKHAPLDAYDSVFEWHLRENGSINSGSGLKEASQRGEFVGRDALLRRLAPRYNMHGKEPMERTIRLPSSKEVVKIPCHKFEDALLQLLTDPRIKDEDYCFHNDDPLAPPPPDLDYVADANTGQAFHDTYKVLVDGEEGKQLVGVIWYLDAAVTGHFAALPVLILKFSLTIFTRDARKKPYLWANLGYLPQVKRNVGLGKKILIESRHIEAEDLEMFDGEGDDVEGEDESVASSEEDKEPPVHAQDFHCMLDVILESYLDVEKTGIKWRHFYRGRRYPPLWYVIFTIYVKVDTDEADVLCGKFKSRGRNVKHVCRNCHMPMDTADSILLSYPFKTQTEIEKLVEKDDTEKLRSISQHNMHNAWHKVRFNQGNNRGIHGATPCEKLHQFDLGVIPRTRTVFFKQIGEDSEAATNIDALAIAYGHKFAHQSDRTIPQTNFNNGIKAGKLMARQYKGVLLIMAAILRSTMGRKLLGKKKHFKEENKMADWLMLVELLLQWEAFLNEPLMMKRHVKRLKKKHKVIMYLLQKVAMRTEGMGLKTNKYHAITHMMEDIVLYGVPMEFDTGANESHHKEAKRAARTTQRNRRTFNQQVGRRLYEDRIIDLASQEINHGHCNWHYYGRPLDDSSFESSHDDDSLGSDMEVSSDDDDSLGSNMEVDHRSLSRMDTSSEDTDAKDNNSASEGSHSDQSSIDSDQSSIESDQSSIEHDQLCTGSQPSSEESDQSSSESTNPPTNPPEPTQKNIVTSTGGARIRVFYDQEDDRSTFEMITRAKSKDKTKMNGNLVDFLVELQDKVADSTPEMDLQIFTNHKRGEHMWNAHPNFWGMGPWNDWVIVNWTGEGKLPCHIHCFVDLTSLDLAANRIQHGGITLKAGTYAVVEVSVYEEDDEEKRQSELFVPLMKTVAAKEDGTVTKRMFYLADTDAFHDVCCVVPDIGGEPNRYFLVHPRPYWSLLFTKWVEAPHIDDEKIEDPPDEPTPVKKKRTKKTKK